MLTRMDKLKEIQWYSHQVTFTPGERLSHLLNVRTTFTPAEWLSPLLNDFHTCWMTFTPAADYHSHTRRHVLSHPWRPQLPPNSTHACTVYWCSRTPLTVGQVHTFHFAASRHPADHHSCLQQLRIPAQDSCCTKGLAMDSMPSAGQMRTTEVPRHTTRPRWRVSSVSFRGSSGSVKCVCLFQSKFVSKQISFFKENIE